MKLFARILLPVAALSLVGSACGKKAAPEAADAAKAPAADVAKAEPDTAKAAEPDTAVAPDAAPAGDAAAAADAVVAPTDYVRAVMQHHDAAKGPVTAEFKTFKVIEANIDLTKLETAKAVIEVDASSISTGNADRDTHVKTPDFLDVAKFATFTITVDRLKAVENVADTFDATATLDLHGAKKELPVQFKVVEKKADSIIIEGETKGLNRKDWQVGGEAEKAGVAELFDGQIRLEVKNVAPAAPAPAGDAQPK